MKSSSIKKRDFEKLKKKKVKLATLVKDDPKAPFPIATTPRCRGRAFSIP